MEINLINIVTIMSLCAFSALISHLGVGVFHDGLRPIMPEYIEGRMKRSEIASIAFGLSVGYIASVGIGNALATNLANPWLLFLATDVIGVFCPRKWIAIVGGASWGLLCLVGIGGLNTALTGLPVDVLSAMGSIGDFIVTGFSLFPIVAITLQFGLKKGLFTTSIVVLARFIGPLCYPMGGDTWCMLAGVIVLVVICIYTDIKDKDKDETDLTNIFSERVARIKKNLPFLMIAGALVALASSMHIMAGSEVSMFDLSTAYAMGDTSEAADLIKVVATNEFMRALSFIPLTIVTAVTTGVYGVAGMTFVYVAGYLISNPILAFLAGLVIIFLEVQLLGAIGKWLGKYPSFKAASDNIRGGMEVCIELSLLIGSVNACCAMGQKTTIGAAGGFMIVAIIYVLNETTGKKIMPMAIGPIATILTGLLLNITYLLGITPLI